MAFYAMTDEQILKMPVTRFWLLNRSIDRISAERDLRLARVMGSITSQEGAEALFERLDQEMGKIAVFNESIRAKLQERDRSKQALRIDFDRDGLHGLRDMGRMS